MDDYKYDRIHSCAVLCLREAFSGWDKKIDT